MKEQRWNITIVATVIPATLIYPQAVISHIVSSLCFSLNNR